MDRSDIPSKIGEYDIDGKLGQGAMGVVYRAHLGDSPVALKVISPQVAEDKEFVHRFLREMQAISTLDHPNIVKAIDFGVDLSQNMYFVALEFIDGMSLQDMLQKRGKLHLQEALEITLQVAKGLDYAYNQGIVHRDIKPDNILISTNGDAKIVDFGLVKSQSHSGITQTGTILGTPFYLAPEQAFADKQIDIRADIYSLGITLYHMLAGRPPFCFQNPMKVITAHCYTPLPPLTDFVQGIPEKVVKIIDKMTAKNREERYFNPAKLLADLEGLLNGNGNGNGKETLNTSDQNIPSQPTSSGNNNYMEAPTHVLRKEEFSSPGHGKLKEELASKNIPSSKSSESKTMLIAFLVAFLILVAIFATFYVVFFMF